MKNQIKTILLLGVLSAVLISVGGALGPGYLYGFTVLAVLLNLGAYFFSDLPSKPPRYTGSWTSWRGGRRSPSRACVSSRKSNPTPSPPAGTRATGSWR